MEDWVELAHGEGSADCHTTKQKGGKGWACAGLAVYRANICKSPRDASAMRLKPDTKLVFSFGEFKKHHGKEETSVAKKKPVEKVTEDRCSDRRGDRAAPQDETHGAALQCVRRRSLGAHRHPDRSA